MSGGARIRVLDQLAAEMPPKIKAHFERARRRIFVLFTTVIQEGVDTGDFRSVDPRTAALAVIGIAVWTSWWYSPTGRQTPQELAEVLVDIAIDGLSRHIDHPRKADTSQEVINSIRRQLAHLENLVADLSDDASKKQVTDPVDH
jgi:hypothetical protein